MLFEVSLLQRIWQSYPRMCWASWCQSPAPGPAGPASSGLRTGPSSFFYLWSHGVFHEEESMLNRFFIIMPRMDIKNVIQMDVVSERFVSLKTFWPPGHFVPQILCLWMFFPYGCFVCWTLYPSRCFVPPGILPLWTFCPWMFCFRTLCLGTVFTLL